MAGHHMKGRALHSRQVQPPATENRLCPIRLLIVAPSLDIIGGQAVQAQRLVRGFQRSTCLEVGFLPHNPRLPGPFRSLQTIKYVRTLVTSLLYFASLLARAWRYDVIHVFSASYYSYLLSAVPAILVAKLYRRKSVLNYRSGEAEDHISRWRLTASPVMKLADAIVVPSGYLVEVFRRFGLRASAVSNVVDTEMFGYRERERLRPVFLSNRNLESLYNVGCILRAFGKIQERYPEGRLIVAGDGKQRGALEAEARELGLRNVEFVGQVTPEVMSKLYREADIYLNSSDIDNMPGSILESFSSGLPVVTTDAGGIPYIVKDGETGLMVRCGDADGLAESAIRLLEEEGLARRIIRNAREECMRYTWSAVRDDWTRLYRGLVAQGVSRGASFGERSRRQESGPSRELLAPPRDHATAVPRAIRILLVAPSMGILGGQAIQAEYLKIGLQGIEAFRVSLLPINPSLPGPLKVLQRVKYIRTLLTTVVYICKLVVRVPRFDVIHVFSASYFSFLLSPTPAILLAVVLGKKTILNYHSGEAEDHIGRWRWTASPVMKLADAIVVPSGYLVEVFRRFGLRASAVSNVVDTEMFGYRERERLRPVFLSNRNLESLYNVGCILRAFGKIQERYPEGRLIVAGDGKQRGALEAEARELGLRNVEFVGQVTPEVMSKLYREADIYLNSSDIDNMPGSILESFSSGLPVVTTDAGGIPYIVRDEETGLMVKRGDAEGLAGRGIRLLEEEGLARRIIRNAREECMRYTWSAVSSDWIRLYRSLASQRPAPSPFEAAQNSIRPVTLRSLGSKTAQNVSEVSDPAADPAYLAPLPLESGTTQRESRPH